MGEFRFKDYKEMYYKLTRGELIYDDIKTAQDWFYIQNVALGKGDYERVKDMGKKARKKFNF